MLPPESNEDFDSQLQLAINDLKNLKSSVPEETILIYCSKDFPKESISKINPSSIKEKLEENRLNT